MTIHKSQGTTLPRVEVDLGRAFEQSHCYVALSRVRDPEDLDIVHFGRNNIGADPQVLQFYRENGLLDESMFEGRDIEVMQV